jgi:hypothetical protein
VGSIPTLGSTNAARAAWQPYAERIAAIEDELRTDLRPAMWKATHAGFGHRHVASRRANDATERVEHAEARIASIHTDGTDVKERLDVLEAEARNLHYLAHPTPAGYGLEQFHREQLNRMEPLLLRGRSPTRTDRWTPTARCWIRRMRSPFVCLQPVRAREWMSIGN